MFFVLKPRAKHINDLKGRKTKSFALNLRWSASRGSWGLPVRRRSGVAKALSLCRCISDSASTVQLFT